jgi:hypothetical protein
MGQGAMALQKRLAQPCSICQLRLPDNARRGTQYPTMPLSEHFAWAVCPSVISDATGRKLHHLSARAPCIAGQHPGASPH